MTSSLRGGAPAVGAGTPLHYLPRAIREPRRPLAAIFVGWLTAFPASILLAALAALLLPQAAPPEFQASGWTAMFALVIFAPVVETLIRGAVLMALQLVAPAWLAIVLSAIGWGVAHSLIAPVWGLVIWWPFLVFSTLFVAWQQRSLLLAFVMPAVVHALQNLIPATLVAYGVAV